MKSAILDCILKNGSRKCISDASITPIVALARSVRDSGLWDKDSVAEGIVHSTEKPMPVMRFRCRNVIVPVSAKKK